MTPLKEADLRAIYAMKHVRKLKKAIIEFEKYDTATKSQNDEEFSWDIYLEQMNKLENVIDENAWGVGNQRCKIRDAFKYPDYIDDPKEKIEY
ncbi:MAG: hypothetical protein PHQ75_00475 [Thermoguttaceae bacterium]|nr:hypothetical protein [Thermoguttaceae bacterium]